MASFQTDPPRPPVSAPSSGGVPNPATAPATSQVLGKQVSAAIDSSKTAGAAPSMQSHTVKKIDVATLKAGIPAMMERVNATLDILESVMTRKGLDYLLAEGKKQTPLDTGEQGMLNEMVLLSNEARKMGNLVDLALNPVGEEDAHVKDPELQQLNETISKLQEQIVTLRAHNFELDETSLEEGTSLMVNVARAASMVLTDMPKDFPVLDKGALSNICNGIEKAISELNDHTNQEPANILIEDLFLSKGQIEAHLKSLS